MLLKESKIKVLENFYAIDYILFGKPLTKMESCCPIIKEEYLSVKGAFLSVFIEMLKLVNHKPKKLTEKIKTKNLLKNARIIAQESRNNSQNIVSSIKSRNNIKVELKEALKEDNKINVQGFIEKRIREKAFGMAIDNLLIARTMSESKDYQKLNEWSGKIIEDSYKILRDSLVDSAVSILYNNEED